MAKALVWATLGRLEKRERNRNIEWKKIEKNVRVPKKIGNFFLRKFQIYEKKSGGTKKKLRKFMTKIGKNVGYQKQNWRQICNTQKSANLKCFKYCRQKSANLKCFKYCPSKYCGHKYCPPKYWGHKYWRHKYCTQFGRGMKILGIYPNVGH